MIFDTDIIDSACEEFKAKLARHIDYSNKKIDDERHRERIATDITQRCTVLRARLLATTFDTMVLAVRCYGEPDDWIGRAERAAILIAIYDQAERTPPDFE